MAEILVKTLLLPLSLSYGLVMSLRNLLFNYGILKQKSYKVPTIVVGNITVGGTGKTPFVEFIVRNLKSRYRIAVLSRGYKRNTHGVRVASVSDTSETIGDEPFQIHTKFPDIQVTVAERRVEGIDKLLNEANAPDLIILDDAFQHRHVKAGLNILLVDYNRPIWKDTPFPGGRLREFARASQRADMVVVTKCPRDIQFHEMNKFISKIKGANAENTFFAGIEYGVPHNVFSGEVDDSLFFCNNPSFVLLTGIASSLPFEKHLREQGSIKRHYSFPDHYKFSIADVIEIEDFAADHNLVIITTEKDAVRLRQLPVSDRFRKIVYYIPIVTIFVDNREKELVYQLYKYLANA